ncbi:MAG: hypothetical protein LC753_01885 [Acidobacteria bacterium]|nr:hypothetical protein [Acidobacteriota bacterium]MCA1649056.1 hypothetical protein [Acidobacteriota bacterium]
MSADRGTNPFDPTDERTADPIPGSEAPTRFDEDAPPAPDREDDRTRRDERGADDPVLPTDDASLGTKI